MRHRIKYVHKDSAFKNHIEVYSDGKRIGSINKISDEFEWDFLSFPDSDVHFYHRSIGALKRKIKRGHRNGAF